MREIRDTIALNVPAAQAQQCILEFFERRRQVEGPLAFPPLGAAGRLFDDAIGHVIAQRTAHQFLLTLAQGVQACFQC